MATQPSFKVVKTFTYKGQTRHWSNRYHFGPDIPASNAEWDALTDAVVTGEKAILPSYVTIISAIDYLAGSDVPVHSKSYSTAGTLVTTSSSPTPGDAAMLVRYSTDVRTSKNHPVYLFNYYHGVRWLTAGDNDTLFSGQSTALGTYAGNWVSGGWVGGKTYIRRGPNGAVALGAFVEPYITHRDFVN